MSGSRTKKLKKLFIRSNKRAPTKYEFRILKRNFIMGKIEKI